jgi:signal peptide peptidase SppA
MKFPHIAARIFNTPLLVHPQKLDAIIAGLGGRITGRELVLDTLEATEDGIAPEMFTTRRGERIKAAGWPGYNVVDGVAVVSANGALVHKTKLDANSDLLLGYNDLAANIEHAMDNPDVHSVLQVWDSPGGEAQGAFEFAQRMFDLRGKKPMWAISDGMAASAAFLGSSAAEHLAVTSTGYAGSIGVVMRHVDFSRALANDGIAVTHIFAGAHKVDGNQFEPLPAAVRADYQAEINNLYDMFVNAVARHLPISAAAVRATEARVFMGKAAVDAGLAHRVATTDQLITELAGLRQRSYSAGGTARQTTSTQGASMSGTKPDAGGQGPANLPTAFTQADIDKARAEGRTEGHAAGMTEGREAGVKAERDRAAGILAHKEATGRTALAVQCVSNGLTVEAAGSILAAAPQAGPTNVLAAAMTTLGNPDVKAGEAAEEAALVEPAAIAASWNKAFGVKAEAKRH